MLRLFLTTAVLWAFATGQSENPCPPSAAISPCYCFNDYPDHYSVACDRVSDMKRIQEVLDATRGRNVALKFENSNLGAISSDLFEGQVGDVIEFNFCEIESFGDRPFSGTEDTLEKIDIFESIDKDVKDLETLPLGHMRNLRTIMLEGNDFRKVGNEWFEGGPTTLEYVSLEENNIKEIGDRAFASLVNLEQIWLGDNPLKTISRSMFPNPAPKLGLLELSYMEMDSLPEDIFTAMPSLTSVNVAGNKLVTLPENTWGSIWNNLDDVYVDDNLIECDNRIRWIYQRKIPNVFHGECFGPSNLQGRSLEGLSLKDLGY